MFNVQDDKIGSSHSIILSRELHVLFNCVLYPLASPSGVLSLPFSISGHCVEANVPCIETDTSSTLLKLVFMVSMVSFRKRCLVKCRHKMVLLGLVHHLSWKYLPLESI